MGKLEKTVTKKCNNPRIDKDQIDNLEPLAFTWSPKKSTRQAKWGLIWDIENYFIDFTLCCKSAIIMPELNKNGNLHYHGTIVIKDKIKWYKVILPKLKKDGFVLIKSIDDMQKWTEYINKTKEEMMIITERELPITLEHLQLIKKSLNSFKQIYVKVKHNIKHKGRLQKIYQIKEKEKLKNNINKYLKKETSETDSENEDILEDRKFQEEEHILSDTNYQDNYHE